jgi:hypothetical protein
MRITWRTRVVVVMLLVVVAAPLAALGSKKAQYVGGTIQGLPEKVEGQVDTRNEEAFIFTADKQKGVLRIPYAQITGLEYGQKAGRRVGVAIFVSPLALFSKKRKHFLTVSYTDADGQAQAVVFELGKDIIRTSLTIVETRSGQVIEYQDEDARKAGRGGDDRP